MAKSTQDGNARRKRSWIVALPFALVADIVILALFYYWFAVADRYRVFLYNHDMGPYVPDTSPFSPVTSSRYWMAGLISSGLVMLLYLAANWLLARIVSNYNAPVWWRVWLLSIPLLFIAIPVITMTQNHPVLSFRHVAQVILATAAGLALAFSGGRLAAHKPREMFWLTLDGFGLMMILVSLPGVQFLGRWLENGQTFYVLMLIISFISGVLWLILVSGLRLLRRQRIPDATELLIAGFALAYLIMPLLHHTLFTSGYYYISDSDNFFARNPLLQLFVWLIALVAAFAITALRRYIDQSREIENFSHF